MTSHLKRPATGALSLFVACLAITTASGQGPLGPDPLKKLWIQEDIDAGYAKAQATGKPLLVAFR